MKKVKKQIVVALLTLCVSIVPFSTVNATEGQISFYVVGSGTGIMPLYNNVSSVSSTMSISSSGKMEILYQYAGFPSTTTKAVITTYIEKRTL